ncbi:MAG: putative protease with the C-terminal domain, partial [Chthonomonadales bacterium]|nr:putative protease with the C-terminal domain [Chthonomonadales bacterium]
MMTLDLSCRRPLTAFSLFLCLTLATACHSASPTPGSNLPISVSPAGALRQTAPQMVYTLRPVLEDTHLDVTLDFAPPTGDESVSIQLPVWSPGDYHRQDFAQYVQNLKVYGDDNPQEIKYEHPDANTWKIPSAGIKHLKIVYALPKMPPGIFSENVILGAKQGFVNGPAALMYVVGHKEWTTELDLKLPLDWIAFTPLKPAALATGVTAAFAAPDYDTLADSPLVFGTKEAIITREFSVNNIKHTIVFFDHADRVQNYDAFTPMLQGIVQAETKIMGGTPYPQYAFFCDINGRGGGLEHLNACRVAFFAGANPNQLSPFFAHEFFHCWNVKRIRPAVLGPFDYVHPPVTRNLWFAEGVTEYYSRVATCRAGLVTEQSFLSHYARGIRSHQNNPARLKISADDASLHVWESGDSQGFGGLSYYDKGELIGLCLDLTIRHETGNRKSLDDVMRLLMQRHNPPKPGYGEDEIRATVNEVAGHDLTALYNRLA